MKKLSILIAIMLLITVGGVYATWTYTQTTDVADESVGMAMNLTNVTYEGSYGTYKINKDNLKMVIDPKEGTTHTTSLVITGEIIVTFTPATYAPDEVKANGVVSSFEFSLTNDNWVFGEEKIISLVHHDESVHQITWEKQENGTFEFILDAEDIAKHLDLTEISLDTYADYEAYTAVLREGQIIFAVSDGNFNNVNP